MKVVFPSVSSPQGRFPDGEPFFAKEIGGRVVVVLYSSYGVFYFSDGGGVPISYSGTAHFDENYKFIRKFNEGEQLVVTA